MKEHYLSLSIKIKVTKRKKKSLKKKRKKIYISKVYTKSRKKVLNV